MLDIAKVLSAFNMQTVRHDNNYMHQFALLKNNIRSAKGKGKAIPLQA